MKKFKTRDIKRIKSLYDFFKEDYNRLDPRAVQAKIITLQQLEGILKVDFKSSSNFNETMKKFHKENPYTGQDIKNMRNEQGLTQKQLSDELGISQQYISTVEGGNKPIIGKLEKWINTT